MISKGKKRKAAGSQNGSASTASEKISVATPKKKKLPESLIKIGLWEYSLKTGRIKWSSYAEDFLFFNGKPPKTLLELVHYIAAEDRPIFNLTFTKAAKTLGDIFLEVRAPDTGHQWLEFNASPATDSRGVVNKFTGTVRDISRRKRSEIELSNLKLKNELISESLGLLIYDYNISTGVIEWNSIGGYVLGHRDRDLNSISKWVEMIHPDDRFKAEQELERSKAELRFYDAHYRFRNSQGDYLHMRDRGLYLVNAHGEPYRMVGIMIDESEQVNALQTLAASEKSLRESERRFERMIEDLNVGIVLLSPDAVVLTANRAAHELLILGADATSICCDVSFVSESGEKVSPEMLPWTSAIRTRRAIRGELLGITYPDEKVSWFLVNADPNMHDHKLLHVLITFTDITERKRMEEHWKESELRFRTLQEASFGGICLHRKGIIVDCNQGLCDLTGYSYEELIGMDGVNLAAPEYRDLVHEKIAAKASSPYDIVGFRKDGSRFSLEVHGRNIPYKDGQMRVTEFRDITDRKLAEEKILEQNARLLLITEDLKQKNDQLQEFTQIVSHNLRSPVGNILALLGLIEVARDEEELKDAIGFLKDAGTTTLTTLTELNQVLQVQQNKKIPRQTLQFADVFNSVKSLMNAKIAEAGAVIRSDFENAPTISFPKIYLESVLLNLISNALKYSFPGRKPEISVKTVTNSDKTISMFVSDNGSGLNMAKYGHHVFKLRKTFHRHPESRGIGLFMIKNQLEVMGGKISLSSVEGDGSVFQVDFNQIPDDGQ
jgi:PAS domain S-box-containing protein